MYDDLVTVLRKYYCPKYSDGCGMCPSFKDGCAIRAVQQAADAIEELSRENESLAKSVNEASEILRKRWIPVAEWLPDVDEKVLTFARNKYDGSWFMDISSWTGVRNHDEYHFWGYGDSMKVTHWMPMPEPPKEGET